MIEILSDQQGMNLALEWAAKGLYITTPNPRVGCVIVKQGKVIGMGHTQPPGQAHAEVHALRDAYAKGHDVRGATAYVTLEPCSHYGRTPPCANALIESGIARVVSAMEDPYPQVSGKGHAMLAAAGIEVTTGIMVAEAQEMNIGFFHRVRTGRPWVRMKLASSLDGRSALHNGLSQWITSAAARDDGHHWRARACAVLTGIGTVLSDNPQLNVRAVATPRQPRRVVIDSRLQTPTDARILVGGGTWIFTAIRDNEREAALRAAGADIICLPDPGGKVDLKAAIEELGRRQINELHVEAGGKLNGSLLRAACIDELLHYQAPILLGDAQAMCELPALTALDARIQLQFHDIQRVGPDLRILARFNN